MKKLLFVWCSFFCIGMWAEEADFYHQLLQKRLSASSLYTQSQMEADIAENEFQKAKLQSIVSMQLSSGDVFLRFKGVADKPEFSAKPSVAVALPSYNNTSFSVAMPISYTGGISSVGLTALVSTDIYSHNKIRQQLALDMLKLAKTQAEERKKDASVREEIALLNDVQAVYRSYKAFLAQQLATVKAEIALRQAEAQGYESTSIKLRTAQLEVLQSKREEKTALFLFAQDLKRLVGQDSTHEYTPSELTTIIAQLTASIPKEAVLNVSGYTADDARSIITARKQYAFHALDRQLKNSHFSASANAGYSWLKTGSQHSHNLIAGVKIQFLGGAFQTGITMPVTDPKKTSITFSIGWNPFSLQTARLDAENERLNNAIELSKIGDAVKDFSQRLEKMQNNAKVLQWQSESSVEELKIYRQNAQDYQQWYERGVVTELEVLQARLQYQQAEIRFVEAKTGTLLFNKETALLFAGVK